MPLALRRPVFRLPAVSSLIRNSLPPKPTYCSATTCMLQVRQLAMGTEPCVNLLPGQKVEGEARACTAVRFAAWLSAGCSLHGPEAPEQCRWCGAHSCGLRPAGVPGGSSHLRTLHCWGMAPLALPHDRRGLLWEPLPWQTARRTTQDQHIGCHSQIPWVTKRVSTSGDKARSGRCMGPEPHYPLTILAEVQLPGRKGHECIFPDLWQAA